MNTRRWLLLLLVASFIWLVVTRANEVEHLVETLASGVWQWVVVAALLQVVYFFTQTRIFQVCLRLVGVQSKLVQLTPVFLASMFINTVAPSGGTAGLALYVDDAIQRGESGARATVGTVLGVVVEYASFGLVLLFSLVYLYIASTVRIYELIAALALLLFTLALTSLVALGAVRPQTLFRVLATFQRVVNSVAVRVRKKALLEENWSEETGAEYAAAAEVARSNLRGVVGIILWAALSYLVNAASLYAVFRAFGERAPVAAVVTSVVAALKGQGDIAVGNVLAEGGRVHVVGTSKGKGFQGVVKRHGFGGVNDATHGQHNRQRAPGSIGQASDPSRVFKGTKMAGRTGNDRVTVKNLRVVRVFPEKNLLLVNGAIPGAKKGFVEIRKA